MGGISFQVPRGYHVTLEVAELKFRDANTVLILAQSPADFDRPLMMCGPLILSRWADVATLRRRWGRSQSGGSFTAAGNTAALRLLVGEEGWSGRGGSTDGFLLHWRAVRVPPGSPDLTTLSAYTGSF